MRTGPGDLYSRKDAGCWMILMMDIVYIGDAITLQTPPLSPAHPPFPEKRYIGDQSVGTEKKRKEQKSGSKRKLINKEGAFLRIGCWLVSTCSERQGDSGSGSPRLRTKRHMDLYHASYRWLATPYSAPHPMHGIWDTAGRAGLHIVE